VLVTENGERRKSVDAANSGLEAGVVVERVRHESHANHGAKRATLVFSFDGDTMRRSGCRCQEVISFFQATHWSARDLRRIGDT